MTLKELVSWVESQSVDKGSIDSITKFAKELNGKIGEINFSYSGNANAIWYSGEIEKTNLWVTVKNISDSNSDWYFLNDIGNNVLNNKESGFNLYSAVEKVVGEEYIDILWNGANDSVGVRTPYSFSGYIDADGDICGIKSICDYVSKEYTLANAKGNVTVILSDNASVNKVFGQTELPTMLSKNDVEKINGIPKEVLLGLSPEEQINILKEKSVIDMMNANIYRGPDGTEILSFKGTKYENIFKTDIPDDYTNVGRYADRVFMSNSELFSKYSFLNESVSQSILDEFRVGEYRLKTTGVDTLTSKNLYFDNSGLLVSIEKKSA